MFKKMFGKDEKGKSPASGKADVGTDPLIDEDETIVVNLSSEEHPKPDEVRVRFDEEEAQAPDPASETAKDIVDAPAAEPTPATVKDDARPASGDETVIWTGRASSEGAVEPSATASEPVAEASADTKDTLTVGWLAVNDGPHRGRAFAVRMGRNKIGRGADNAVDIDIGDAAISKDNHVTVAADPKTKRFFAIPGDSTNFAYLNGDPLLDAQEIADGAAIQVGETTLVFVQFVGRYVDWD